MRRLVSTVLTVLGMLAPAAAFGAVGETRICVEKLNVIDAAGMDASRSFTIDTNNWFGGYDTVGVYIDLTDANTSITRFDMTCTASLDGNAGDYTFQVCTTASGACTSDDASWRKASPGTAKYLWRVDISDVPDFTCTFSVGTGAGASGDLLSVDLRLCVE